MYKSLKILFIAFFLFMFLLPNFVHAIDINMNLTSSYTDTLDALTTIPSSTVSNLNNLPEASLGLSNVLSIILIVIGILIILLAIAILIRLKN